ncbi:cell division protein FtsK [Streptomyces oryzae]|uniref:Cell division protein FtsK n=2 Tax=Streptomyces oryzae TaxID=1434886 RepID=A0ABS3XJK3_9ACTN|nr:cell division protein FtsK [Streptomyces oryzae]
MRQEVHIRRGWKRLARMAGLSVTDRTPTFLASLSSEGNQEPKPRVLVPKISTSPDAFGVNVTVKALPKAGLEEFQRAAPYLADAWGCTRLSVRQKAPGTLLLRAVRRDPLISPTFHTPSGQAPDEVSVWGLGLDEYAEAVSIPLANVPGVAVAGLPGFGKTSLINRLICDLAPSSAVQFAVADGKVSEADEGDYADLQQRLFAFAGDDLADANALFRRLVELRRQRSAAIRSVLGVKNLWHKGPVASWPLTVLIIDEAQTYFRDHKGSDRRTKDLAALAAENARLVEDLVKKGRSVGMLVIVATQKATGDAIPTFIRDVCPVGLSFAQKTAEASVAALGEDIRNWPDANPVSLQDPRYVGVAVMAVQGREGFSRIRTPYVDDADAARIAVETAHLTKDPTELLTRATALSLNKPLGNAA